MPANLVISFTDQLTLTLKAVEIQKGLADADKTSLRVLSEELQIALSNDCLPDLAVHVIKGIV